MNQGFPKGDPRARLAGQKGGAIHGEQKKRASMALWVERFPGVTPEAARAIYNQGYQTGFQSGAKVRKRQEASDANDTVS